MEPEPAPGDDILFGIAHCETALQDGKEAPSIRAIHLAYAVSFSTKVSQAVQEQLGGYISYDVILIRHPGMSL